MREPAPALQFSASPWWPQPYPRAAARLCTARAGLAGARWVAASRTHTWLDGEYRLLPWQPDLITWLIKAGVSGAESLHRWHVATRWERQTDRQASAEENLSTSALCKKWGDYSHPLKKTAARKIPRWFYEQIRCNNVQLQLTIISQHHKNNYGVIFSPAILNFPLPHS